MKRISRREREIIDAVDLILETLAKHHITTRHELVIIDKLTSDEYRLEHAHDNLFLIKNGGK